MRADIAGVLNMLIIQSQNISPILYHRSIPGLQELLPGREGGLTRCGEWAKEFYKIWPIFLSLQAGMFIDQETNNLHEYKIDSSKLDHSLFVSDLPSLADHGMYISEECGWWEEGQEPQKLLTYLNNGEIDLYELVEMWDICSQITQTIGYMGKIVI